MSATQTERHHASGACDRCGGELIEVLRPKVTAQAGRIVVVRGVPLQECRACGEAYLPEAVALRLDQRFSELLAGAAEVAITAYEIRDRPEHDEDMSALADATFDSLARHADEARQYARMLHYGHRSGLWDPGWFGVPDDEGQWPTWLTSVESDYAATSELPPELLSVSVAGGYSLRLTFADGVAGIVDAAPHLWGPAFQPVRDPAYFARVQLIDGTAAWPNGADLAPETLYREALRNQVSAFHIDADLNMEDDAGRNMGRRPEGQPWLVPGAVATAGRPGAWSWVVVDEVEDGFVFFHQISANEAERLRDTDRPDDGRRT